MGDERSTKIAKMMVLCWQLTSLPQRSNLLPYAFVSAIYIYIESIEVTCRSTVVKIVLIGNLRWPSSCLYLLYFPATVLFTCIKSWFFRNHLANFSQISHWSYCCDDRIGKMLHNICISAVVVTQVSEPWPVGLLFISSVISISFISHFLPSPSLSSPLLSISVPSISGRQNDRQGWFLLNTTLSRSRSVGFWANWSGSALFVIQFMKLYQQLGSKNLTGWKLEVGGAA